MNRPTDVPAAGASIPFTCDVLVIGGGPAGSTIAALLEKGRHPRFHIGESLLPANAELFERLGVRDRVEAIGMRKWGVEFVSPDHDHKSFVEFAEAFDTHFPAGSERTGPIESRPCFARSAKRGRSAGRRPPPGRAPDAR